MDINLKPAFLRAEKITTQPETVWKVKVKIISAAALQKPKGAISGDVIDPYIEIDMIGLNANIISAPGALGVPRAKRRFADRRFRRRDRRGETGQRERRGSDTAYLSYGDCSG
jgi:hypothetical protein